MKKISKLCISVIAIAYLVIMVVLRPGFAYSSCSCGYEFMVYAFESRMDCSRYCEAVEPIGTFLLILNVLLYSGLLASLVYIIWQAFRLSKNVYKNVPEL